MVARSVAGVSGRCDWIGFRASLPAAFRFMRRPPLKTFRKTLFARQLARYVLRTCGLAVAVPTQSTGWSTHSCRQKAEDEEFPFKGPGWDTGRPTHWRCDVRSSASARDRTHARLRGSD